MQRINFSKIIFQSFAFMIFLYILHCLLRLIFIIMVGIYQGAIDKVEISQLAQMFHNAFLYDGQIIGVMTSIFFGISLLSLRSGIVEKLAKILLKIYIILIIFITAFVGFANIGFYEIYKETFNATLLGLIFDDRVAIFQTALKDDFGILNKIILWLIFSFAMLFIFKFLNKKILDSKINSNITSGIILFIIFGFAQLFAINGNIGLRGISLGKEIIPVSNPFLRQITMGGFRDLGYVYKSYVLISNSKFSNYIDESPLTATRFFFKLENNKDSTLNLESLLTKEVNNPHNKQIEHIFYIIAESFSSWHFDKDFESLGLTNELQKLLNSGNALKIDILQNAANTIKSLDVQISGLYQFEIPLNLSVGHNPIFKTSAGYIFKDLGYENRFYYGGSGTWQKIDSYTKSQGFDKIFYNTHIIQNAKDKGYKAPYENSWGAYDNHLYNFIKDNTLINSKTKSFSMILSTSYHPPYDVPLEQFDIELDKINNFVENNEKIINKDRAKKILSHIIYQDKMISKFIKEMANEIPNSLFVITGDHYDREYPFSKSDLNITNKIPFIIYAPNLEPKLVSNIGSHIDIVPSIVELVAPNGYKYMSFGMPLFSKTSNKKNKNALGYFAVSNENFIYNGKMIEYFDKNSTSNDYEKLAKDLFKDLNRAKALSWWIFNNGYTITESTN